MTIQDERLLRTRLSNLASRDDDSDWSDVRRRAGGRNRAPLWLVAGAILVVAAAAPALGLSDRVVGLFESSKPAPEPIKQRFDLFPAEMAPDVIAEEARTVIDVPTSDGFDPFRAILYVAPTESGGYCTVFEVRRLGSELPGGGSGRCDRDRVRPFLAEMSARGPIASDGIRGPVVYHGYAHDQQGDSVRFDFEDGDHTIVPLVWVSKPIDAAFFVYPLPKKRWVEGHRPVSVTLQDAGGEPLRKQPLHWFLIPPRTDR